MKKSQGFSSNSLTGFKNLSGAEKQRAINALTSSDIDKMEKAQIFRQLNADLSEVWSIIVDLKEHHRPRRARICQKFVAVAVPSGQYYQGDAERRRLQEARLACKRKLEDIGVSGQGEIVLDKKFVEILKVMGSLIAIEGKVFDVAHQYKLSDLDNLVGMKVTIRVR
jgi:hypothetical protein